MISVTLSTFTPRIMSRIYPYRFCQAIGATTRKLCRRRAQYGFRGSPTKDVCWQHVNIKKEKIDNKLQYKPVKIIKGWER